MESGFELRILNQHFLTEELTDACSHGQIFLRVCSTVISDADDGDWSINEAALSLMRSVKYGFPNKDIPSPRYYPEGMTEDGHWAIGSQVDKSEEWNQLTTLRG